MLQWWRSFLVVKKEVPVMALLERDSMNSFWLSFLDSFADIRMMAEQVRDCWVQRSMLRPIWAGRDCFWSISVGSRGWLSKLAFGIHGPSGLTSNEVATAVACTGAWIGISDSHLVLVTVLNRAVVYWICHSFGLNFATCCSRLIQVIFQQVFPVFSRRSSINYSSAFLAEAIPRLASSSISRTFNSCSF